MLPGVDFENYKTNQAMILPNYRRSVLSPPLRLRLNIPQGQQENDEAKEVFDMLNDQLITELPQFLELRVPYFDPSFEAMIRMQSKFAEEGYEKLSGVQRSVVLSSMLGCHSF